MLEFARLKTRFKMKRGSEHLIVIFAEVYGICMSAHVQKAQFKIRRGAFPLFFMLKGKGVPHCAHTGNSIQNHERHMTFLFLHVWGKGVLECAHNEN